MVIKLIGSITKGCKRRPFPEEKKNPNGPISDRIYKLQKRVSVGKHKIWKQIAELTAYVHEHGDRTGKYITKSSCKLVVNCWYANLFPFIFFSFHLPISQNEQVHINYIRQSR